MSKQNRPREEPFSYHQHAQATIGEERGGRYTNKALGPVVTGADPPPKIEGEGPWSTPSGVPDEEPLGVAVDAPIDIGWPSPPQTAVPSFTAAADGAETFAAPVTPTTVDARRSPQIHKRRRLK
jgi:hypothetical protein